MTASKSELLDRPQPRRFQLRRREDVSGMSGTGIVAEGVKFRDGTAAYKWLTSPSTLQVADSVPDIQHIHGHNGRTTVRFLDGQESRGEAKSISEVYQDRNRLAAAFAMLAHRVGGSSCAGGWQPPAAEDADADEWAVCWARLPTGQVSWHVPRSLVEATALVRERLEWDGHDRDEKNDRLLDYARLDHVTDSHD